MQAAYFLIAIMGCGESSEPCQQLRLLDTRYQSQAACFAATEAAVTRFSNIDYPVVVAQCQAADAAAIPLRGADVALPEPEATALFPRR